MGIISLIRTGKWAETPPPSVDDTPAPIQEQPQEQPQDTPAEQHIFKDIAAPATSYYFGAGMTYNYPAVNVFFDGEKELGGMGPLVNQIVDYDRLRVRAYEMYLVNDLCNTLVKRKNKWLIGAGLSLQAQPVTTVLEQEGYPKIDPEKFNKEVEARWHTWGRTRDCDFNGRKTFAQLEKECAVNRSVGGDVLVILRLVKGVLKVQHIDAANIFTPPQFSYAMDVGKLDNNPGYERIAPNGRRVRWGVEIDDDGKPTAFYVRKDIALNWDRVPAYNSQGLLMAFLVLGSEYRIDSARGIPEITPNMESAKQLDKYKQAIVGSAVERERIPYFFEHELGAVGQGPIIQSAVKARTPGWYNPADNDLPRTYDNKTIANNVAVSTNKSVFDLNPGTKVKAIEGKVDENFAAFYSANIATECATFGIPPEVALMKYEGSFSSSRAGLKDWEHSLYVDRADFATQYNQRIYEVWLHIEVLAGKISAPGYLNAFAKDNTVALSAYRNATWEGAPVPHIDPLKEVNAWRAMLGPMAANMPLTTNEAATRALNNGNFNANLMQFAKEMEEAGKYDIEPPEEGEEPEPTSKEPKRENEGSTES